MMADRFESLEPVLSVVTADSVAKHAPSDRVTGATIVRYRRLSVHLSGDVSLPTLLTLPGKPSRQGYALSGSLTC